MQIEPFRDREEAERMTMQMILKAKDGYLLASDTRMVNEDEVRTVTEVEKVIHLREHKVAYMVAGDECAIRVADDFGDSVKDGTFDFSDIGRSLRALSDQRWKIENESLQSRKTQLQPQNRTLLALFYNAVPAQAWKVSINEHSGAWLMVGGFIKGGASSNSAWFFLNKYHKSNRAITELLPLAVHTLCMGSSLDSSLISGLQILTYSQESNEVVPISDLEKWIEKSRQIDASLYASLLSPTVP